MSKDADLYRGDIEIYNNSILTVYQNYIDGEIDKETFEAGDKFFRNMVRITQNKLAGTLVRDCYES